MLRVGLPPRNRHSARVAALTLVAVIFAVAVLDVWAGGSSGPKCDAWCRNNKRIEQQRKHAIEREHANERRKLAVYKAQLAREAAHRAKQARRRDQAIAQAKLERAKASRERKSTMNKLVSMAQQARKFVNSLQMRADAANNEVTQELNGQHSRIHKLTINANSLAQQIKSLAMGADSRVRELRREAAGFEDGARKIRLALRAKYEEDMDKRRRSINTSRDHIVMLNELVTDETKLQMRIRNDELATLNVTSINIHGEISTLVGLVEGAGLTMNSLNGQIGDLQQRHLSLRKAFSTMQENADKARGEMVPISTALGESNAKAEALNWRVENARTEAKLLVKESQQKLDEQLDTVQARFSAVEGNPEIEESSKRLQATAAKLDEYMRKFQQMIAIHNNEIRKEAVGKDGTDEEALLDRVVTMVEWEVREKLAHPEAVLEENPKLNDNTPLPVVAAATKKIEEASKNPLVEPEEKAGEEAPEEAADVKESEVAALKTEVQAAETAAAGL